MAEAPQVTGDRVTAYQRANFLPSTVASAIAIPESVDLPQPDSASTTDTGAAPSLKRRKSSVSDTDSKRRRLSTEDDSNVETTNIAPAASPPREERRKSRQLEERERKRGQRLFGALLGTLSQGSSNAAQKRRADIEKRQQDKLKQQNEDDEVRRKEKVENLKIIRRKEQVKYEERTMRLRHKNMLHFAKFLRTKTEPRLYYKPWELQPEQEDEIQRQIDDAQTIVAEELEAYERRREQAQENDRRPSLPGVARSEPQDEADKMDTEEVTSTQEPEPAHEIAAEAGAPGAVSPDDTASAQTQADDSSATAIGESVLADEEMRDDEQGEHVLEAEEDTVIY